MGQDRLNDLMMLAVHKDQTDAVDIIEIVNEFVSKITNRTSFFGKFKQSDIKNVPVMTSKSTQTN